MDLFKALCIVGMIMVHVYLDVSQDAGMANTIVGDYIAVFVGAHQRLLLHQLLPDPAGADDTGGGISRHRLGPVHRHRGVCLSEDNGFRQHLE